MPTGTESLDYRSVRRAYRKAQELYPDRFGALSMEEFAQTANKDTGTNAFDAGLVDNPIKRVSSWVDDMLEPVSRQTGGFFGELAGTVDPSLRKLGEDVGASIPRAMGELGAAAAGTAALAGSAPLSVPLGIGALALGAGSAAAKGYTDTGSPLVGAISGATTAAMPGVGRLGGKVAAKALAPTAIARGEGLMAQAVERGAEAIGANTFAGLLGEASRQGTSLALGQGPAPVGTKEHIAEMVIGQVPFALLDVVGAFRPTRTVEGPTGPQREVRSETEALRIRNEVQRQSEAVRERADIEGRRVGGLSEERAADGEAPAPAGGAPIAPPAATPTLPAEPPLLDPFAFRNDPAIASALDVFAQKNPGVLPKRATARRAVQADPRGTPENQFLFQAEQHGGRSEESLRELLDEPIRLTDPDALEKVNRLAFMYDRLIDAALRQGGGSHLATAAVKKEMSRESLVRQMVTEMEGRGLDGIEFGERLVRRLTRLTKDVADVALSKEQAGNPYAGEIARSPQEQRVLDALRDVNLFDQPENAHLLEHLRDTYERAEKRLSSLVRGPEGEKAYDELVGSGLVEHLSLGYAVDFLKSKQTLTDMYYTGGRGKGNDPLLREGTDDPVMETFRTTDELGRVTAGTRPQKDASGQVVTNRAERSRSREILAMQEYVSDKAFGSLSTMLRKRIGQLVKEREGVASTGTKRSTEGGGTPEPDVSGMFVTPEQAAADAAGMSRTERFSQLLTEEGEIPISTWITAAKEGTGASKVKYAAKLKALGDDVIQALQDGQLFLREFKDGKTRLVGKKDVMETSTLAYLAKRHGYDTDNKNKGTSAVSDFIQNNIQPALEWMVAHKEKGGSLGGLGRKAAGRAKSNHPLPSDGLWTKRVGSSTGLFYGTKVKGGTERLLPSSGDDVLTIRDRVLENEGDGTNAPMNELLNAQLLTIDKDLFDLVDGKEGIEQPLDTDLLVAIQLKRDGYNVVHTVDPYDASNVVSMDLRHVTEEGLLKELKERLKQAEDDGESFLMERFDSQLWKVREASAPRSNTAVKSQGQATARELSDAELAKKHPELERRAFLGSSIVGAEAFFRTYFDRQGMSPMRTEHLTQVAMRVAAAFDRVNYARIADLTGEQLLGVYSPDGADIYKAFVGLGPESLKATGLGAWTGFHILGHELGHANIHRALVSPMDMQDAAYVRRAIQSASALSPEERASVTGSWLEAALPPRTSDQRFNAARTAFIDSRMMDAARDPHEMLADLSGVLATAIASPSPNKWLRPVLDKLEFSSAAEQDFAKGFYLDVTESMDAIEKWTNYRNPGVGSKTREIAENLRQTLSTTEAVGKMVDAVNTMRLMEPERYFAFRADSRVAGEVSDYDLVGEMDQFAGRSAKDIIKNAREALGMGNAAKWEKENGLQPGWMTRTFKTAANLAEEYPMMRPLVDLVFGFRALTSEAANDILRPFMTEPDKFGRSRIDSQASGLKTVARNEKANRVASELALLKNEKKDVLDTDFMLNYAKDKGLSEKEANDVVQFHRNVEQVMPRVVRRAIQAVKEDGAIMIGTRAMLASQHSSTKVTWKQAKLYGDVLMDVALGKTVRPDMLTFAEVTGRNLGGTPGFGDRMGEVAKSYVEMMRERAAVMADKPWYMPEVRLGRYYVYVPQDAPGATPLWGFETKAEALRKVEALRKDGRSAKVYDKTDREGEFAGVRPDAAEHWSKIESAVFERAITDLPVDQQMYLREAYQPGEAVMRELKSRGSEKHLQQRQLAEGREELNMVSGFLHYVTGVTTGLAKQHVKNMSALMLSDPTLIANPKVHKLSRQLVQNVLYPTANELTALKQLNFLYFMGLNPASMVAELSQTFVSYVPYLIEQGSKVGAAYRNQMWAFKEMFGAAKNQRFSKEEYDQAMRWAQERQVVDFGVMSEMYNVEDESVANLGNLAKGQAFVEPGKLVTNAVNWAAHWPRLAYSTVTRLNSRVAFLGAYKFARETKRMDQAQAREFAAHATRVTMFGGGLAARPVGMFANLGKAHGVMGAAYSLQSYTFGMYGTIARLIKNSIDKGVAGEKRSAARKAAGTMLGTQFVLAGALGLPMSTAVLSLVNQLFPEAELERKLRTGTAELMKDMTGADDEMGATLGDIFLHGAADQTGMDFSGRVGLGSFLGVSPYNGLTWENLAGPTGSVLSNAVQAGQHAVRGEGFDAARKILPRSMKNLLEAYDQTAFRDPSGQLMMDPSRSDTILAALGLGPAELKRLKQAGRLQRQAEEVAGKQRSADYGRISDALVAGNAEQARGLLAEMAERSGGLLDTRSAARTIAQMTLAKQVPDDPTRGVDRLTAASVGALRRSMGVTPGQQVSEVERAQQIRSMMMELGVRTPRPGRQSRRNLAGIDALLSDRPDLTYGEAASLVRR